MVRLAQRTKLSAVDTAWLRMDRPGNLMMICAVLTFGERLDSSRVKAVIDERLLVFRRFRQRAAERGGVSFWEDDPRFDLDRHVVAVSLPGRARKRELESMVSRLVATPLDPDHPMWQFHVVERYGRGSALVGRVHHCYADGIALVRVMLSMTDAGRDGPPAMPFKAPPRKAPRRDPDDPLAALIEPIGGVMKKALAIGATVIERGVAIWNDPEQAKALLSQGTALTEEVAKIALMGQDSPTRFKGTPGVVKRVAWADPLPLSEVKAVGKALRASVNDVLLACVAGALRSYLVEKGDDPSGVTIRALVPVNLRPMERAYELGNEFGLVFLDLPIGIENPVERLYAVRANMNALKGSYQPILALGILAAMGSGPKILQDVLLQVLARNATAVMTNVPGPQEPLWFAGAPLTGLMFWVPQSGDIGIGVSIISYAGSVQFGMMADRNLCPDPDHVIARFRPEFETLLLTTLLSEWPSEGDLDPARAEATVRIAAGLDPVPRTRRTRARKPARVEAGA